MNRLRKRLVEKHRAAREGRRFGAFYRGAAARKAGKPGNPFPPGSDEARCWEAGWQFAEPDEQTGIEAVPPVCRFGPGGDFVRDWPEGQV